MFASTNIKTAMSETRSTIVICGAGIAGIAAAYELAVRRGIPDVVVVDERPPLSLTSDKSTECYRNWWPGPGDAMVGLMNRSIDLLEQLAGASGNVFGLNRRGYLYAATSEQGAAALEAAARESSALGSGPLRVYRGAQGEPAYLPAQASGYRDAQGGADLILDPAMIGEYFPYLAPEVTAVLHARRCGWLSAQQLGMYLWDEARRHGARLVRGRVTNVQWANEHISGVEVLDGISRSTIATEHFVNAAGPFLKDVAGMLGQELPVHCTPHLKLSFDDRLGVVPRDAPMIIAADPVSLVWSDEERAELAEDEETRPLLDPFPAGVHTRPDGGADSPVLLLLWSYDAQPIEPVFPLPVAPEYPELALRGMARLLPGLRAYLDRPPRPVIDGGYYVHTQENRPLIGPLGPRGAWMLGALSGYGVMAALAAAELLAAHITGAELPPYAAAFQPRALRRSAIPANVGELGRDGPALEDAGTKES